MWPHAALISGHSTWRVSGESERGGAGAHCEECEVGRARGSEEPVQKRLEVGPVSAR